MRNCEPRLDNFTFVKPSRKKLRPGDVFVMHYDWLDGYVLGRVIKPNAQGNIGMMAGSNLIYLYAGVRNTKELPDEQHLLTTNLLVPPMFVNRSPWSLAGVEMLANVELHDDQVLEQHCFVHSLRVPPWYFDDEGNRLEGPVEPVGNMGLQNIRSMDLLVSRAMGLPEPTALHRQSAVVVAEALRLIDDPDGGWVSVCLMVAAPEVMELGQVINDRFDEAYMNGYNWEALVARYLEQHEPDLLQQLELDSEADMCTASMKHSPANVATMRTIEAHLRAMLADGPELLAFIEQHRAEIKWE